MFCAYCGAKNVDDATFCQSCGRKQEKAPSSSAMATSGPALSQTLKDTQASFNEPKEQPTEKPSSPLFSTLPPEQHISQSAAQFTPPMSSLTSQQHIGSFIVISGGLIALFAFFFLPYLSLGIFGSLTGSQLANTNNQLIQGTGALWLEPLVAVAVIGIAIYLIVGSQKQEMNVQTAKGLAITLIFLGGITLLVLLIRYSSDAQPLAGTSTSVSSGPSIASFYGTGIWIYFFAMLIALVGGIVQLRSVSATQ